MQVLWLGCWYIFCVCGFFNWAIYVSDLVHALDNSSQIHMEEKDCTRQDIWKCNSRTSLSKLNQGVRESKDFFCVKKNILFPFQSDVLAYTNIGPHFGNKDIVNVKYDVIHCHEGIDIKYAGYYLKGLDITPCIITNNVIDEEIFSVYSPSVRIPVRTLTMRLPMQSMSEDRLRHHWVMCFGPSVKENHYKILNKCFTSLLELKDGYDRGMIDLEIEMNSVMLHNKKIAEHRRTSSKDAFLEMMIGKLEEYVSQTFTSRNVDRDVIVVSLCCIDDSSDLQSLVVFNFCVFVDRTVPVSDVSILGTQLLELVYNIKSLLVLMFNECTITQNFQCLTNRKVFVCVNAFVREDGNENMCIKIKKSIIEDMQSSQRVS